MDPRTGLIADFGDVKLAVGEQVLVRVDHRVLNDLLDKPTAENIARWIWEALEPHVPGLAEVRLYEIPDSCVTYRGPGGRRTSLTQHRTFAVFTRGGPLASTNSMTMLGPT